jgi:hypothetical protein
MCLPKCSGDRTYLQPHLQKSTNNGGYIALGRHVGLPLREFLAQLGWGRDIFGRAKIMRPAEV